MLELRSNTGVVRHIPDDLTLVQFMLDSHHDTRPVRTMDAPWIIEDKTGRKFGLEEIRVRTYGLANALSHRYKIKENDVVLIYSQNHIDYLIAIWAAHRLGAIISGANPLFTENELVYQIKATKSSTIITHPESLKTAQSAAKSLNIPDSRLVLFDVEDGSKHKGFASIQDLIIEGLAGPPHFVERKLNPGEGKTKLAFLNFSSGTTGRPKAVAIPHYAPIANVIQFAVHNKVNDDNIPWERKRFRPGDVCLAVLPLYHIYGLVVNTHYTLFCGMAAVIVPKFNFMEFMKSIVQYRVTHLMLVPPQVVLLCKHPAVKDFDFSCVRYIMSGAAPLSTELIQRLVELFPNSAIGQSYGTTETSTILTSYRLEERHNLNGSAGVLVPGVVARVLKMDGTFADYDEPGELLVQTPSMTLGYAGDEKATNETFKDGWFHTGDEVKFDKSGELFVLDRLKEMIKVRGFQVAPAELEGCLLDHPDVADCCVVSIQDDYSGELPMAFVVLHPHAAKPAEQSATRAEEIKKSIKKHVSDNKVAYKQLAGGIEFTDAIPRNPSGKLLRRVLRDKARQAKPKIEARAKM